jgi:hypothetical protein
VADLLPPPPITPPLNHSITESAVGGIRTHTWRVLSPPPLPVGLLQRGYLEMLQAGLEPARRGFSVRGLCRDWATAALPWCVGARQAQGELTCDSATQSPQHALVAQETTAGLEIPTDSPKKTRVSKSRGTKGGTVDALARALAALPPEELARLLAAAGLAHAPAASPRSTKVR